MGLERCNHLCPQCDCDYDPEVVIAAKDAEIGRLTEERDEARARGEKAEAEVADLRRLLRRIHEPHIYSGSPEFEVARLRCLASTGLAARTT